MTSTTKINWAANSFSGSTPISIPTDYIGLNSNSWPLGGISAPSFGFTSFRLWDCAEQCHQWCNIELTAGNYTWTTLDSYFSTIAALSTPPSTILYTIHGTPEFYAQTAAQSHTDEYGNVGGGSFPTTAGLTALGNWVTALVTRYPQITHIETENEPTFGQNYTGLWWGSAANLVTFSNVIRTAAKAVRSTIKVCGPAFNTPGTMSQFLAAQDPTSLNFGYQIVDSLNMHCYRNTNDPTSWSNGLIGNTIGFTEVYNNQTTYSLTSKPIIVSEFGIDNTYFSQFDTSYWSLPVAQRKLWLIRAYIIPLLLGSTKSFCYAYSSFGQLSGDLRNDTNGAIAAISTLQSALPGQTINSWSINGATGVITLNLASGTVLTY